MTLTSDQLADSDRDGFLVVRNAVDDERLATEVGADTWYTDVATLTLEDADRVIELAEAKDVDLRVGYSRQYAQRYAVGHEEISQKKIGGLARCYDTQAVAAAILKRSPTATPVMDILTYLVDFIGWCHPHARPIEVTVDPRPQRTIDDGHPG